MRLYCVKKIGGNKMLICENCNTKFSTREYRIPCNECDTAVCTECGKVLLSWCDTTQIAIEKIGKHHELKTWSQFYQDIIDGKKTFEVRKNDQNFQIGEYLMLIEVDSNNDLEPTGRKMSFEIIYMLEGEIWGLQPGYTILGIKK